MAVRIEIDIFSGRPNPVIELKGSEARQALERLRPVRRLERGEPGLPQLPTLGYRGLIVEQTEAKTRGLPRSFRFAHGDLFGPRLLHRAEDEDFEEFVLRRAGLAKLRPGKQMPDTVRAEIRRFRATRQKWPLRKFPWPTKARCACAPLYEPDWWNVPEASRSTTLQLRDQLSDRHVRPARAGRRRDVHGADLCFGPARRRGR